MNEQDLQCRGIKQIINCFRDESHMCSVQFLDIIIAAAWTMSQSSHYRAKYRDAKMRYQP